jgi:hypothetical protein
MQQTTASGVYASLKTLLAALFRATVIKQMPSHLALSKEEYIVIEDEHHFAGRSP